MRVILNENPLTPNYTPPATMSIAALTGRGRPIWISPAEADMQSRVVAYRLQFAIEEEATIRVHVTADERYELWLDGVRLGRGPERGSERAWFYESYDLALTAGKHVLVAVVWGLGALAAQAQVSIAPGFLLATSPEFAGLLATGGAAWEVKPVDGSTFSRPAVSPYYPWFSGANQRIDALRFPWGVEAGEGEGWGPVVRRHEDILAFVGSASPHPLVPAMLPAQLAAQRRAGTVRYASDRQWDDPQNVHVAPASSNEVEVQTWQAMMEGGAPVLVPPHSSRQIILDLGTYVCAYPELMTSGGEGAEVSVGWAEALFREPEGLTKGHRNDIEGRYFVGLMRDEFRTDGELRHFTSLWWRAGRFVQLLVTTADQALTVMSFALEETRYPLEMESRVATSDARLDRVFPIALRGLQMCAHETYMDCPYYEQLMYVGDTRIEALTTYAISADDRLPRKALRLFDVSRLPGGPTRASYPSRDVQVIPPFALWWVAMVHDFAMWRDDRAFVRSLLPGVRAVLDHFIGLRNEGELLAAPPGWNFADWAAGWAAGVPPGAASACSGLLNWHLVYTLGLASQLEESAGDMALAQRYARHRDDLATEVTRHFWNEERGLFADDLDHAHYSEHTQCLAVLSGMVDGRKTDSIAAGLREDPRLARATIYFSHYLFEAYRRLGQADALFARLQLWFDLPQQGFTTTPEQPEPSRSDCHGWGAHPLFHGFATILGIRPAAPGFARVEIRPLLGPLSAIKGSLVHLQGRIDVELRREHGQLTGSISLPEGVSGCLHLEGHTQELVAGLQRIGNANPRTESERTS